MSTKQMPPLPENRSSKLVVLDRAFKLAEQWVSGMSGSSENKSHEFELEGRPARLGIGAAVPRHSKPELSNDPVKRKLLAKLNAGKKKATNEESNPSAAEKCNNDDDEEEEDLESRTHAFAKKRAISQISPLQAKKKRK